MHAVGVLHRDIKPSNVLMEGRTPILIDFGLARVADDPKLTHTGWLLGTPGYLAPEILYGDDATAASDVHSWAATVAYAAHRPAAVRPRPVDGDHGPGPARRARPARLPEHAPRGPRRRARPRAAERPTLAGSLRRLQPLTTPPSRRRPPPSRMRTTPFTVPARAGATARAHRRDAARSRPDDDRHPGRLRVARPPGRWTRASDRRPPAQPPVGRAARPRAARRGRAGAGAAGARRGVPLVRARRAGRPRAGCCAAARWPPAAREPRRRLRGRSWYDGVQLLLATPWHLVQSIPGTVMLALWSAGLAAAAALVCYAFAPGVPLDARVLRRDVRGRAVAGPGRLPGARAGGPRGQPALGAAALWPSRPAGAAFASLWLVDRAAATGRRRTAPLAGQPRPSGRPDLPGRRASPTRMLDH